MHQTLRRPARCLCPQVLGSGRAGPAALEFAVHLVRTCVVGEPVLAASDLFATLETLAKLARTSPQGAHLQALVEQARRPRWVCSHRACCLPCVCAWDGARQQREAHACMPLMTWHSTPNACS